MIINFDGLKKLPIKEQSSLLRDIKNQLIGSIETKKVYFDSGLIEVIVPMLADAYDADVCSEILMVLNFFTFEFPKAVECLGHFKSDLIVKIFKIAK